ncbi:MAG: hypothetical protein KY475_20545 [Planctomycetes bacterium]|nr:hypothetical protein [Planctomycetota bacterium]
MRHLMLCLCVISLSGGCASLHHGCGEPPPIVCPKCHEHCACEVEKITEKKVCFDVECEAICIPRVKFWWEDCCKPPRCAKTRLVNVLVEKDYECERCGYKWTPVCCEKCVHP